MVINATTNKEIVELKAFDWKEKDKNSIAC